MPNYEKQPHSELSHELLQKYAATFINRLDQYAIQRGDGRYVSVKKPLSLELLAAHLMGHVTLGTYALDTQSRAKWVCLDADTPNHWDELLKLAQDLDSQDMTPYLEPSRRGGHLWLFFSPISGQEARRFGNYLLNQFNLDKVELFPKQDQLTTGPGSLVRLPLGIHRKVGRRYHFMTLTGGPIAPTIREQVQLLASPSLVPLSYIERIIQNGFAPETLSPTSLSISYCDSSSEALSERLKNTVSVYDFVSHYVELDPRGLGYCPFHDDQHKSFGVNQTENFWSCFAGCGGGSIIDFWMKWREKQGQDASFKSAITELARILF